MLASKAAQQVADFIAARDGVPASKHNAISTDGTHLGATLAWVNTQTEVKGQKIDLSKIGEQAIWIRQLLGYKQSDAERMANFDRLMHKTETAFQVKPRKRRDKRNQG